MAPPDAAPENQDKGRGKDVEARCHHCGHVHSVADDIFQDREKANLTCPQCGQSFQVINPKLGTLRIDTTRKKVPTITSEINQDGRLLRLPESDELSLKVLEGEEKGTVYPLTKPRITVGRANADVSINDALASRVHCTLEISDQWVLLRDLGSTNGTLVDDQPIQEVTLSNGSTFRVGSHVFQLVITPKGA